MSRLSTLSVISVHHWLRSKTKFVQIIKYHTHNHPSKHFNKLFFHSVQWIFYKDSIFSLTLHELHELHELTYNYLITLLLITKGSLTWYHNILITMLLQQIKSSILFVLIKQTGKADIILSYRTCIFETNTVFLN